MKRKKSTPARIRQVPAGKFKDSCLRLMDEVHDSGVPLIVTKRGKPIVRVLPIRGEPTVSDLRGTVVHEDEDIFSTGDSWTADS